MGYRNKRHLITNINDNSSRSHSIFTLSLKTYEFEDLCSLSIVDLAGSEKLKKAETMGKGLKETCKINTSLLVLKSCFEAMKHNKTFKNIPSRHVNIPFRESKLTLIFKEFLTNEDSNIVLISHCHFLKENEDENLRMFNYSALTKNIKKVKKKVDCTNLKYNILKQSWSAKKDKEPNDFHSHSNNICKLNVNEIIKENQLLKNEKFKLNLNLEKLKDHNDYLSFKFEESLINEDKFKYNKVLEKINCLEDSTLIRNQFNYNFDDMKIGEFKKSVLGRIYQHFKLEKNTIFNVNVDVSNLRNPFYKGRHSNVLVNELANEIQFLHEKQKSNHVNEIESFDLNLNSKLNYFSGLCHTTNDILSIIGKDKEKGNKENEVEEKVKENENSVVNEDPVVNSKKLKNKLKKEKIDKSIEKPIEENNENSNIANGNASNSTTDYYDKTNNYKQIYNSFSSKNKEILDKDDKESKGDDFTSENSKKNTKKNRKKKNKPETEDIAPPIKEFPNEEENSNIKSKEDSKPKLTFYSSKSEYALENELNLKNSSENLKIKYIENKLSDESASDDDRKKKKTKNKKKKKKNNN